MTGRQQRKFRSGHLNEALGVLFLRGIAAVATVPNPDDVGVDAISTLFRPDGDLLIAEDTFYVQLKSASDKVIKYNADGLAWLKGLKLPFFIGSVDRSAGIFSLFGTNRLSERLITKAHKSVKLYLQERRHPADEKDPTLCSVSLGEPVSSWSLTEVGTPALNQRVYKMLKPYLQAEQRNAEFRNIRYCERLAWKTDQPESIHVEWSGNHLYLDDPKDIIAICRRLSPTVQIVGHHGLHHRNRETLTAAVMLIDFMRRCGHDPDPADHHHKMLHDDWLFDTPTGVNAEPT